MSIKIHHGPDGTFKTSGAIKDDILKLVKTDRTLVTNVRGFSRDKCIAVLGEDYVHPDFNVLHIDTDAQEGRDKLSTFFHWAPKGAFFVIDEVQRVIPPHWRESDLKRLDYPHNQDHLPESERRPENIHAAFDMQRHHNWDFVFTTTNIKKVHNIARVMAKVAVRHVNMGIWRFYKAVEHDPESNGKQASSITSTRLFQFVPKQVFELYASTTTGSFTNTEPRTPFYKDPKILGMLIGLGCLWAYILTKPAPKALSQTDDVAVEAAQQQTSQESRKVDTQENNSPAADTARNRPDRSIFGQYAGIVQAAHSYINQFSKLYLVGYTKQTNGATLVFSGIKNEDEYQFNSDQLHDLGIETVLHSECLAALHIPKKETLFLTCPPNKYQNPTKQEDQFQAPSPSQST